MEFSVIIPIYNAEKTLARCLNSLLVQADQDTEIILVNDGSKDSSGEICIEYQSRFPHVHCIFQENRGVSAARNVGLKAAAGENILFVDSDDSVAPNYFSILRQNADSDLLVFGESILKNGIETGKISPVGLLDAADRDEFLLGFVRSRNGSPCNKRFRRDVIHQNDLCFPEDLRIGEDFVFCLRYLLQAQHPTAVTDCIYLIDETDRGSNSRRYNADSVKQALLNYRCSFSAVEEVALESELRAALFQILDYNYYRTCFACVQELFKVPIGFLARLQETRKVLVAFSGRKRIPPLNFLHKLMCIVVNGKLTLAAYCITALHRKR